MKVHPRWRLLGWRHPLWDYVRFWSVVQKQGKQAQEEWKSKPLGNTMEIVEGQSLPIPEEHVKLFFDYLAQREQAFETAMKLLRTEEEALAYCDSLGATVTKVRTQSQDHHQSSAAMVAAVSFLAGEYCLDKEIGFAKTPSRRCVWLVNHHLHVTARNLDGAIPSLNAPKIIWEIKEYWGKTSGGSKMSDAVYECALVGLELRDFEERAKAEPVTHVVFLDGQEQWAARKSDLKRFIDLAYQGLVDHLVVGREVETRWVELLKKILG